MYECTHPSQAHGKGLGKVIYTFNDLLSVAICCMLTWQIISALHVCEIISREVIQNPFWFPSAVIWDYVHMTCIHYICRELIVCNL